MLNLTEMVTLQNQTGEVILQLLMVLQPCYTPLPMPSSGALSTLWLEKGSKNLLPIYNTSQNMSLNNLI